MTLINEVRVQNLQKTFRLSAKQQRLEHTSEAVKIAVNDLSFTAQAGEIFGLLGPNGAGKTTTLRLLATLLKPDAGDAWVAGYSIVSTPEKVRATIGFLTSELKLEDFFTPDYLFDFFAALHQVDPTVAAARKAALFRRFDIQDFAAEKVGRLSSGMKQKASLAISIAHDPEIIIFDEPTNGLDVITARVVTDYLTELKSQGKTIILSSHIFSLVEKLCDRVGIIIDGRMIVDGRLAEVCAGQNLEDRFFELYSASHPELQ
ncbi:MAG: ABC transporter ATP-binding protein [Actinomycetia bacterium]|nr:ABC transporter ATP-binding protein [Actinomycetes bacterium]